MNLNDIGLLLGSIASMILTIMPRIEDVDLLAVEGISWQREVKNFRNRVFYRSALGMFSIGFLMQYAHSSWMGYKSATLIIFELLAASLLIGMIVLFVKGVSVFFSRGVHIRARYIPMFKSGSGVFGYNHSWVYIIENKSIKKHYSTSTFHLPMKAVEISAQQNGKEMLALDKNTMSIAIPEIEPRSKIYVRVEGLAASDVQGSSGDAYLSLEDSKVIHTKTVGPISFDDY